MGALSPPRCFGLPRLASGCLSRSLANHGHASSACAPSHFEQQSSAPSTARGKFFEALSRMRSAGGSTYRARTPGGRRLLSPDGRRRGGTSSGCRLRRGPSRDKSVPPPVSCRRRRLGFSLLVAVLTEASSSGTTTERNKARDLLCAAYLSMACPSSSREVCIAVASSSLAFGRRLCVYNTPSRCVSE